MPVCLASTAARLPAGQHAMMDRPVRSTLSSGSSHSSQHEQQREQDAAQQGDPVQETGVQQRTDVAVCQQHTYDHERQRGGAAAHRTAELLHRCGSRQPVASSTSIATVAMLVGVMKVLSRIFSPGRNRHTT